MTNKHKIFESYFFLITLCVILLILLSDCATSNKVRPNVQRTIPVKISSSKDTIDHKRAQDSSSNRYDLHAKSAPDIQLKHDTINAEIIRKSKLMSQGEEIQEERSEVYYTVQIGAFEDAANALRKQIRAKEQFKWQKVFNNYKEGEKKYYVSIGMYREYNDAFALADSLRKQYPDEYNQCWVRIIQ